MDRDTKEIYTITVVRNFGVPLSFTIEKRKVALMAFIAALIAGFLLYAAVDYLVVRAQNSNVKHQLSIAEEKMTALTHQVQTLDQKYYASSQAGQGLALYKKQLSDQQEIRTQNLWEQTKGSLSVEELQEGTAVDIDKVLPKVKGDTLSIKVTLVNQSNPDQAIGGYLCITLVNEDTNPIGYKSATGGPLGKQGYPSSYKQGRQYFIKNKGAKRSVHQSLSLKNTNEYYTSALIFVYSYKGTLLNRSEHSLDKAIFLE